MSLRSASPISGVTVPIRALGAFLEREWSLQRQLIDRLVGTAGEVTGTARWSAPVDLPASGAILDYEETGELRLGSHRGPVSRRYRYVLMSESRAEVFFADGRTFHPLDLSSGWCRVDHRCGDDRYRGWIQAASQDELHQHWHVLGPRKDYTITTVYRHTGG
jgi:hypothetical protein